MADFDDAITPYYRAKEDYLLPGDLDWRRGHIYSLFVQELGDKVAGKKVLHCGCNTGTTTSLLAEVADSVAAVDINPRALAIAKEQCPKASFYECSIHSMPFPDGRFDILIVWDVYEHIRRIDAPTFVGEMIRVLKTGGYLSIYVPVDLECLPPHERSFVYPPVSEFPLDLIESRHETRLNPGRPTEKHDGWWLLFQN